MRLINSTEDLKSGYAFSSFLTRQGIQNQTEIVNDTDWGSPNYGIQSCKIWIVDEDQVSQATKYLDQFLENPNNPIFSNTNTPYNQVQEVIQERLGPTKDKIQKIASTTTRVSKEPFGKITLYLLLICCIVFAISQYTTPQLETIPNYLPSTPFVTSPVSKTLLYDYPLAYELTDQLDTAYGLDKLQHPSELSSAAIIQVKKINQTPYWKGFYDNLIHYLTLKTPLWKINAPLFEKIREGEFWRLITPIFLHGDIFHLFFNMVWLAVIGKQIEQKIGIGKYLLFIVVAAIFTNTIQYLVSGSNFIGFSGVLCAMITFVWRRQKSAAWEGYLIQKSTYSFIMIFIFGILGIEIFSFFLEINGNNAISPGIANAAHISGLALGTLLGRLNFFKIQYK